MNEHKPCCPPSWRDRISEKLGTCPQCMRASLLLAAGAWIAYSATQALAAPALLSWASGVAAGCLTLLAGAHLAAFFVRAARAWQAGTFAPAVRFGEELGESRRGFLAAATALLAALLFAPLLRLFDDDAVAQQSRPCNCTAPDPQKPKPGDCRNCACQTPGDPKKPKAQDCSAATVGTVVVTEVDGKCKGSATGCTEQACKKTRRWMCNEKKQGNQKGHQWEQLGQTTDDCPAPPTVLQTTTSTGKCKGQGCKQNEAECEKQTVWRCDPKQQGTVGGWTEQSGPNITKPCQT